MNQEQLTQALIATAKQIAQPGKGILAADESLATIGKRFVGIQVENTEANRRIYREFLLTTPELATYISGVILFEETLGQKASSGGTLGQVCAQQGMIPGIKVDKGLVNLPFTDNEKVTQGLDGLAERITTYKEMGARFAKWRATFDITAQKPSYIAVDTNAHALARYAAICQQQGIVPIVEPEVLMDGDHSLSRCQEVTEWVLNAVFTQLHHQHVLLEGIVLKPSMVTSGQAASNQASVEQVAHATICTLLRTVPPAVPSINFLSGGQSAQLATAHLNAMNALYPKLPWNLSFSYGRALQAPSLAAWQGQSVNIPKAQQALLKRAKLNGLASTGNYRAQMEEVS